MLLLALAAAALGPSRLPPVDQCASDRSFVQFRTALRRSIARRDVNALLETLEDDVQASLGGDIGKRDFVKLWKLESPRSSKVWKELGDALSLGCAMNAGVATAPSFEEQLGDGRDAFETRIALPGAVLHRGPSQSSAVIARLNWDVLTQRGEWDGGPWLRVSLDDGRRGHVRKTLTRSPIDYRAWFHKRDGRWRMAGFVAGD